jgi:tight adherence protein B
VTIASDAARRVPSAVLVGLLLAGSGGAAFGAEEGPVASISSVQNRGEQVQVLVSLDALPAGASPDLDSLELQVGDSTLRANAELASDVDAADGIQRTAVLALDASESMRGERFAAAKEAARAFTEAAPEDVRIGVVAFSGDVQRVQTPTTDRDAVLEAVDSLTLDRQTLLYPGVAEALDMVGSEGSRSVLVLSDGKDTTGQDVAPLLEDVKQSGVQLDVVSLGLDRRQLDLLGDLADAGSGDVLTAADPAALTRLFTEQAAVLQSQVLVNFKVPDGTAGGDETLAVSIMAAGQRYSDSALVSLPAGASQQSTSPTEAAVVEPAFAPGPIYLTAGLAAFSVALLAMLLVALGVLDVRTPPTVVDRLSPYQQGGSSGGRPSGGAVPQSAPVGIKRRGVQAVERVLSGGVQTKLAGKLDAAGLKLTPAEWALTHAGIVVMAGLGGFMLSGGDLLVTFLLLAAGAVLPWYYLKRKRTKRLKAFDSQLADTLQLLSGSLSAGLSFTQSIDTVVREGSEPVSGEFRRSLVEQRLGVDLEESLDGVAKRMQSADFAWVVMAIRIQRQVGGNLAELLLTVASTLREREHLRRQVKVLSAEGVFSAWILGGLPPVFILYLLVARREYLAPMWQEPVGLVMSGAAAMTMAVGVFWMSKAIKVEV